MSGVARSLVATSGYIAFDSLEAARELEAAGFERNHAEAMVKTIVAAREAGREDLATKADLARVEARLEAKLAAAINKMLLGQVAVAGLLFAALKLF